MSMNPEDANRRKVTIYECPSPGCQVTRTDIYELQDHINSEHEGEWDRGFWPEPETDE